MGRAPFARREITRHYAVKDGLRDAYNTFCTIRTDSLRPATAYDYRLCSKRIDDFQPYRVTFGDSIVSRWYAFRTPDPRSEECSFIALSDMHGDSAKLAACSPWPASKVRTGFSMWAT